ncbi:hypothetical protein ACO0RG_004398 [Hanseniaspora osmophila]
MDQYLAELEQTLQAIVVPNSANLKDATKLLQTRFYADAKCVPALIHLLVNSNDSSIQQLAGVEARKQITKYWEDLDASTTNDIKASLLSKTFTCENKNVRHTMARVIGEIGSLELDEKKWPELMPYLFQTASSTDNAQIRETAIFVIFTVLEQFNATLGLYVDELLDLFSMTIVESPQSTLETRSLSAQAIDLVSQLIEEQSTKNPTQIHKFAALVPAIVNVLEAVIQAGDSVNAKLIFNCFQDFLLLDSQIIGNAVLDLINLGIQISSNAGIDEDCRIFAMRFVVSALSYKKNKITQAKLGSEITLTALKIASEEIDEEEELTNEDEAGENEEDTPSLLAVRMLAYAATELPPSQVANVIVNNLAPMLQSSNKYAKRAILLAISVAVNGSPEYILTQLESKIVPATLQGLKDPEPIVQLASLKALHSLSVELQDDVAKYHEQFLPAIIEIIDSAKSVVIYRYATMVLDGLLEFIAYEAIVNYLEPLMNKLFHMLDTNTSSKLRAVIVSAIGSAAFAAGSAFVPYFKPSVQYLEKFIQNSSDINGMSEDDIELRALTFENISTMGRAVRSEVFAEFAEPLVSSAYEAIKTDSARLRESGYAFIANMAKVYGKDFAPFLANIMPEIFKTLQLDEYEFNLDEEDEEFQGLTEEDLMSKFNVNTGVTYEKEVAAAALVELALATKESFLPYVEETITILKQQVEESYGLKETVIVTYWAVVKSVILTSQPALENKFVKGLPTAAYVDPSTLAVIESAREVSLENLVDEAEVSVVTTIFETISEMISKFGSIIVATSASATESLDTLCLQVLEVLKGEHSCQVIDFEEDAPKDEEEEMESNETETILTTTALEILVSLSTALTGAEFGNIFNTFKPVIFSLFNSKSKGKRVAVVGAVSEIAFNLGESNTCIQEMLEQLIIKLTSDKNLEVRGNAAYGVGALIRNASFDVTSVYQPILKALYEILSAADQKSQDDDDETTRETLDRSFANCNGCVGRMILKHDNLIPLEHTLPALLNHLPLSTGYEEYDPLFELIIKLYGSENALIMNETPKIVSVFSDVFKKETERVRLERESTLGREENLDKMKQFQSEEMKQKVVELLKFLNTKFNGIVSNDPILAQVIA